VTVYYDPAEPAKAVLERVLPMGMMVAGGSAVMLFFVGGPLLAAFLYLNGVGWLEGRLVNPDRAPLVAVTTGLGLAVSLFTAVFAGAVRRACAWPVTQGRITAADVEGYRARHDSESGHRRSRILFKPGVTYTYEVDGRRYAGDRLTMGATVSASFPGFARRIAARYPVGGTVDVHYNPLDPGESVLRPRSVLHHLLWMIAAALFAFA
jgi:Protein of unknown function (DUF3592)